MSAGSCDDWHTRFPLSTRARGKRFVDGKRASTTSETPVSSLLGSGAGRESRKLAIARRPHRRDHRLRSDHSTYTVDGAFSNHSAGRAMDIGAVDGEICRGTRTGPAPSSCASSPRSPARCASTELIYCWDPDGPADPRGFARADHCDHIHWGMDA